MASIQSSIRAKVKLGNFPTPKGAEAFPAYAIASGKGLIPEMENAARQTLDHPMTFEVLGEGLRLFEIGALSALASFRKRCRENLVSCIDSFIDFQSPRPSSIWVNACCREIHWRYGLPNWLYQLFSRTQKDLRLGKFTHPLDIHLRIRGEYLAAFESHVDRQVCLKTHVSKGSTFCTELENNLAHAQDKVTCSLRFPSDTRVK